MAKIFEASDYVKWRSFRDSEDSRYVTLTLPRILLRLPYGPDGKPVEELNYIEDVDGKATINISGVMPHGRLRSGLRMHSPFTVGLPPFVA